MSRTPAPSSDGPPRNAIGNTAIGPDGETMINVGVPGEPARSEPIGSEPVRKGVFALAVLFIILFILDALT